MGNAEESRRPAPAPEHYVPEAEPRPPRGPHEAEAFLLDLDEAVRVHARKPGSARECAASIHRILCDILEYECGTAHLLAAIGPLFHRLAIGGGFLRMFIDLFWRSDAVARGKQVAVFEPEHASAQLRFIAHWYQRRVRTLARLVTAPGEDDIPYGLHLLGVRHDVRRFGTSGFEVDAAVCMAGRAGKPLWIKVFVLERRTRVRTRKGWESWTDCVDTLFGGGAPQGAEFCAAVPFVPDGERLIVDGLKLFVPYAALGLGRGRRFIELQAMLCEADGNVIVSAERADNFTVRPGDETAAPVPSPQSVGLWERSAVRGDHLARARVYRGGRRGAERIEAAFDLSLACDSDDQVTVTCALINTGGFILHDSSSGQPLEERMLLGISSPFMWWRGLVFGFGVELIDRAEIDPSNPVVLAEIRVSGEDGKVRCGTILSSRLEK
jgi:hypothetical protein